MKVSIVSDLHIDPKNQKVYKGVPITFYVVYKQLLEVLNKNPDVLIIQGDLINNIVKVELVTINLLVLMFLKFFVQVKKIPIYIIQGNHDVFFTSADDGLNDIGSFVTIFKNTRNVFPFTTYKRVQLLPNFNLHLIPYTNNVDNIYKSIKGLNKHFNLFVFHQDYDFINEEYGISNSVHVNRIVKIDRLMEKLKGHNYYILNGHYHKHKEYDDYNFSIISSLSQNSFSEQINTIDDIDKYFGYMEIDFKNRDDYTINFYPSEYRIVSIKYQSTNEFLSEFNRLKDYIISKNGKQFFNIRVINDATDENVVKEMKEKVKELGILENVLQSNQIKNSIMPEQMGDNIIENTGEVQINKNIDVIQYFKEWLKTVFVNTEYEKKLSEILKQFDYLVDVAGNK